MSVWWDNTGNLSQDQRKVAVHALIIATSLYDSLPSDKDPMGLRDLRSVTRGAVRFARWLKEQYFRKQHPVGTIRLLLSPTPEEKTEYCQYDPALAQIEGTTRKNVDQALKDWRKSCRQSDGGVAVFFVAGHGLQYGKRHGAVLLQDYKAGSKSMRCSVDIGRVHQGMLGQHDPPEQLYFVDACRSPKPSKLGGTGLGFTPCDAFAGEKKAPVFFATVRTGTGYASATSSLFSQALLDCLDRFGVEPDQNADGKWFVSTTSLNPALEGRVHELAVNEGYHQMTVTDELQNFDVHVFGAPPPLPVTVVIDPPADAAARARIYGGQDGAFELKDQTFTNGKLVSDVPIGSYHLDVSVTNDPSLQSQTGVECRVRPRMNAINVILRQP